MVIILELIKDNVKGNTILCQSAVGENCASPNDYYDWEKHSMDVILQLLCPNLMNNEHRIFMTVPNTKKALVIFAFTQANLDFEQKENSFTTLIETTRQKMQKEFPNLSNLLVQRLQSTKNTHMMTSGLVYHVDIF